MHDVLSSVQNLNEKSREIFQRLEAAISQADGKILQLEDRLAAAAARVEAARGSTAALKVESARTFCGRGKPQLRTAHLVVSEDVLLSVRQSANLPEELGAGPPSASTSAEELARVTRSVTHHCAFSTPDSSLKSRDEKLLPVAGRLSSVSELFLLNSSEQPYRARHEVDNLAELEEDAFLKPRTRSDSAAKSASQRQDATNRVDLEEDEPERAAEDLRFRPRPATAEVTFDLPEVLPDLGHVAHIKWTEGDTNEGDRPAWDVAPADVARRASMAKPRPVPKRQAPAPPRPTSQPQAPAPAPALPAPPISAVPAPKEVAKPKPAKPSPPPPAPKAKGEKGKGKGKGKGPPPPPAKKPGSAGPPAKPPAMKAEGAGKAAMFADIRSGTTKLKKVAAPKERSGAAVGRVV